MPSISRWCSWLMLLCSLCAVKSQDWESIQVEVSPYKAEAQPGVQHAQDRLCGHSNRQCRSLKNAIECAQELRMNDTALDAYTNKTAASLGKQRIRIILNANAQISHCQVLVSDDDEIQLKSTLAISNQHGFDITIEGSKQNGCDYARLYQMPSSTDGRNQTSKAEFLISIKNSSVIQFRQVAFEETLLKDAIRQTMIHIGQSSAILFDQISVVIDRISVHAFYVYNSCWIYFKSSLIRGLEEKSHTPSVFDVKESTGAIAFRAEYVDMKADFNVSLLREEVLAASIWTPWMYRNVFCPNSNLSSSCLPSALLYNCTFEHLGEARSVSDQRTSTINIDNVQGIAIDLHLHSASNYHVLVDQCMFTKSIAPFGGAIVTRFTTASADQITSNSLEVGNSLEVRNSHFIGNSGTTGSGVLVQIQGSKRSDNCVRILNTLFRDNIARTEAAGVAIFVDSALRPTADEILISGCEFYGNRAGMLGYPTPGSAILIRSAKLFDPSRSNHAMAVLDIFVVIDDCCFSRNFGLGSVHIIGTSATFLGNNTINNNDGTALHMSMAYLQVYGHLTIQHNTGYMGGAVHLAQYSIINASLAQSLTISGNDCKVHGAAIFADETCSSATTEDILYGIGFTEQRPTETCPVVFPTDPEAKEKAILTLLQGNPSPNTRSMCNAVFMSSMFRCLAAFQPFIDKAIKDKHGPFVPMCYCMPYPPAAWETFGAVALKNADLYKSTRFKSVRDKYISELDFQELCLIDTKSSSSLSVNGSSVYSAFAAPTGTTVKDPSSNISTLVDDVCRQGVNLGANTSTAELNAFKSLWCSSANPQLHQPERCYSTVQDHFVMNQVRRSTLRMHSLGTRPAWMFFDMAGTSCFKNVDNNTLYFQHWCRRENITKHILKGRYTSLSTDCALFRMAFLYHRLKKTATPILPGYKLILTPWAGIINYWDRQSYITSAGCQLDLEGKRMASMQSIAEIVLHPAPGEEFLLNIIVADEMFNHRPATLKLKVQSGLNNVLLGHNGYVQELGDEEVYSSHLSIRNLALYGPVGATGEIVISLSGDINYYQTADQSLALTVPFQLRQCHLGFIPLFLSPEEAQQLAGSYKGRHAGDRYLHNVTSQNDVFNKMGCQCAKKPGDPCIQSCDSGRDVRVYRHCWAGDIYNHTATAAYHTHDIQTFNRSVFADWMETSRKEVLRTGTLMKQSFAAEMCDTGRCLEANASTTWVLSHDDPCRPQCNCGGVYCTECKEGFSQLPSSASCVDCQNTSFKIPFWLFFVLEFIICLLVVCVMLLLNVGITSTLDSWLFFSQVYFALFASGSWFAMRVTKNVQTFGIGSICLSDIELKSGLPALATNLFVPLVLLLLILSMWTAARKGKCVSIWKRMQTRNSIVHVFWLVVLCSLSTTTYMCFSLLRCVPLGHKNVVYIDGSVGCFSNYHLPYAILAIIVLVVVVLPPPVLLLWKPLHLFPSLKLFLDEASHIYEDKRRWWAALNIFRRLLLSLLHALVVNGLRRRLATVSCLCFYVACHAIFRPFRRSRKLFFIKDFDNVFELGLLLLLTLLSILQIVEMDVLSTQRPLKIPTYMTVTTYIIVTLIAGALTFHQLATTWRDSITRRSRHTVESVYFGEDDTTCSDDILLVAHLSRCSSPQPPGAQGSPRPSGSHGLRHGTCSDGGRASFPNTRHKNFDLQHPDTALRDPLLIDHLRSCD